MRSGETATADVVDTRGTAYLVSLPRRIVTVYVPLGVFLLVLLFPFYWMTVTAFKPNEELLSREGNPFWVRNPTLDHIKKLLFETSYPDWLWNTMLVAVVSTAISAIPELIDDGASGLLVPEKDVPALAGALARLLEDAGLRRRLGHAAREKVRRSFNAERTTRELKDLFASRLAVGARA